MKKTFPLKSLLVSMAVASSAAFSIAPATTQAEVTGNIGATSNYMWRGLTMSNNKSAIQGGVDYANESGFYLGTWTSSLDGTYEIDGYLGFGGSAGSVDYDIGYIYYAYPRDDKLDAGEVYGSVGMSGFTLGGAVTTNEEDNWGEDTGDVYVYGSYGFDISEKSSMSFTVGNQSYAEKDSDSYTHAQVSLSMSDFTFAIDQVIGGEDNVDDGLDNEGDMMVSVMYSKSFEF
jgi:uncharacterized protein (TIGR02001 family)